MCVLCFMAGGSVGVMAIALAQAAGAADRDAERLPSEGRDNRK